jgi:SNF2 family DNA or RNA helicase
MPFESVDVVITTYALVSRDLETLQRRAWHRVVLDEAQYIKNPPTKQARAIRSISTPRRVALTGTPVENRLSELWSIMEFCNPGYLGPQSEFRRRFAVPVERHRDPEAARMLRMMVRPFVLRRLKSDPKVISDLPPCVESKEYATLTAEQAALYQQCVHAMLSEVESSNGMQRRGLILAALVKLKQICNHPLQLAGSEDGSGQSQPIDEPFDSAPMQHGTLVARSGKCRRLIELLEEVVASDEKALVFTQFRQMGHLLTTMIRAELDCDALFLHGGTSSAKRQQLIDRFQDPRGGAPVFILSLKAGGLGLNLTAANHVFHFDRWWNPAVENQATDRAFRIGQKRTVQVHKFVCQGTLEERIDEMIEEKTELAENVIGAGEQWLTELSSTQLRDMLMLRQSAMEVVE